MLGNGYGRQQDVGTTDLLQDGSATHWLSDCGPVYDCLVWDSGSGWRAAIDTSQAGDLGSGLNLGVFRETREWGLLGERDQVFPF